MLRGAPVRFFSSSRLSTAKDPGSHLPRRQTQCDDTDGPISFSNFSGAMLGRHVSASVRLLRRRRFAHNAIPREESPYGDRSAVTRLLWDERLRQPREHDLLPLVDKHPGDSFMELVLPFSSDPVLREQYISPFGHVRIGRLLEDLDAFAGNVAFRHAFPSRPTIVTASIDKLDLVPRAIDPNQDLRIAGGVTSVGTSSMEIRIDAFQGPGWPTILTTYFTMVARDPVTKKSTAINPLIVSTELEKQRKLEGDR